MFLLNIYLNLFLDTGSEMTNVLLLTCLSVVSLTSVVLACICCYGRSSGDDSESFVSNNEECGEDLPDSYRRQSSDQEKLLHNRLIESPLIRKIIRYVSVLQKIRYFHLFFLFSDVQNFWYFYLFLQSSNVFFHGQAV